MGASRVGVTVVVRADVAVLAVQGRAFLAALLRVAGLVAVAEVPVHANQVIGEVLAFLGDVVALVHGALDQVVAIRVQQAFHLAGSGGAGSVLALWILAVQPFVHGRVLAPEVRVAVVRRADVVVVTVRWGAARADPRGALVVLGTGVTVFAGCGVVSVGASRHRFASVVRAHVAVIAIRRIPVEAAQGGAAGFDPVARVPVVAQGVTVVVCDAVAVVVDPVAGLHGPGENHGILRFTIRVVWVAVPVLVPLALVADTVEVHVLLTRVGHQRAVVVACRGLSPGAGVVTRRAVAVAVVRDSVVVVVRVHAIGQAVPVRVRVLLVDAAITVVVEPVAMLRGAGIDGRFVRAAVRFVGIAVPVPVGIAGVAFLVAVQVFLSRIGHHGAIVQQEGQWAVRPHVRQSVAVRVAVAGVAFAVPVQVGALFRVGHPWTVVQVVGHAVAVPVPFAGVAHAAGVEVGLVRVGHQGAVVVASHDLSACAGIVARRSAAVAIVRDTVVVVVRVHAIGQAVPVRIRVALVRGPVAVVVQAVAIVRGAEIHGGVVRPAVRFVGVPVAVPVQVAGVAFIVTVQVLLPGVEHQGAVVLGRRHGAVRPHVGHAVSFQVAVAGVALAVLVQVRRLVGVGHVGAVVPVVGNPVGIPVFFAFVAHAAGVEVGLVRVGHQGAVVVAVGGHPVGAGVVPHSAAPVAVVQDAVVVVVGIHAVGQSVAVCVGVSLVRDPVAVVVEAVAVFRGPEIDGRVIGTAIRAVGVAVPVTVLVAGVARPVRVQVFLCGVGVGGAIVFRFRHQAVRPHVGHAVAVQVAVAHVAFAVLVQVRRLIGIGHPGAVVLVVGHAVAVPVPFAGVAHAAGVEVGLVTVGHQGAVVVASSQLAVGARAVPHRAAAVPVVRDAVVVVVGVHAVGQSVPVRVRVSLVRDPVAVVVQAVAVFRGAEVHRGIRGLAVRGVGVAVSIHVRVAGVAGSVPVQVLLAGVGREGAVVIGVGHRAVGARVVHAVAVRVAVARVAFPVPVQVHVLFGVGQPRTGVQVVDHAVAVPVPFTGVAYAAAIQVGLVPVGHQGAVVVAGRRQPARAGAVPRRAAAVAVVQDAVVVVVRVHAVGQTVPVGVGVGLVHHAVTVVVRAVAVFR